MKSLNQFLQLIHVEVLKFDVDQMSLCHKIPISLQSEGAFFWYSKLRLFVLTEFIVWNIYGLRPWVAKYRD